MPKPLSESRSVVLAPTHVTAATAARIAAYVARPSLFRPSTSAVVRAAIEAGIDVLERAAVPLPITLAVECAPAAVPLPVRPVPQIERAPRAPRKPKTGDAKRSTARTTRAAAGVTMVAEEDAGE